ncbi:hypothetical protein Aperf_G00000124445 [Anoplocephala perfoliata]
MTISYVDDISDGSGILIFIRILRRWMGSVYKLLWADLLVYLAIYFALSLTYRFALPDAQKRTFEDVVRYCEGIKGNIPVSFLLGFFVTGVIGRWYNMYMYIPWMNHMAYMSMTYISCGDKNVALETRLSLMRYMNLAWILLMRRVSDPIADRFKDIKKDFGELSRSGCCKRRKKHEHKHAQYHPWSVSNSQQHQHHHQHDMVEPQGTPFDGPSGSPNRQLSFYRQPITGDESQNTAITSRPEEVFDAFNSFEGGDDTWSVRETFFGFNKDEKIRETFGKIITEPEVRAFEAIAKFHFRQTRQRYIPEYWVPIHWAVRLIQKAGLHGHIPDSVMINTMLQELGEFRKKLQNLEVYSSITMPLVYTQVVIIAVYSYIVCDLLASQFIEVPKKKGEPGVDFIIPIFSIFNFLFFLGWLKVALCVMNPFGDDDEDFETSDILDYNLDVSYRSSLMDGPTYPEKLKAATLETKGMNGVEDDNLNEFVKRTQNEMQKTDNIPGTYKPVKPKVEDKCCQCFPRVNYTSKDDEEYRRAQQQPVISSNNTNNGPKPTNV